MTLTWKDKYTKYKTKYLDLQHDMLIGGTLHFEKCKMRQECGGVRGCVPTEYELLKKKTPMDFESLCVRSTIFDANQKMAIEDFVKYVIPNMKMNGKLLGDVEKQIEVMHAGTFGVTVYVGDLLIKIINISKGLASAISEVSILINLEKAPEIGDYKESISEFFGYMTSNMKFVLGIGKDNVVQISDTYATNIPSSGESLSTAFETLPRVNHVDDSLLFLMQRRASISASAFAKRFKVDIRRFMNDTVKGVLYMHAVGYIHNDIKPDNIVYNGGGKIYQLIDFGLSQHHTYDGNNVIKDTAGTPAYFIDTIFGAYNVRSFFYDWHCLYISILEMLHCVELMPNGFVFNDRYDSKLSFKMAKHRVNAFGYNEKDQKSLLNYFYEILGDDVTFINIMNMLAGAQRCAAKRGETIKLFQVNDDNTVELMDFKITSQLMFDEMIEYIIMEVNLRDVSEKLNYLDELERYNIEYMKRYNANPTNAAVLADLEKLCKEHAYTKNKLKQLEGMGKYPRSLPDFRKCLSPKPKIIERPIPAQEIVRTPIYDIPKGKIIAQPVIRPKTYLEKYDNPPIVKRIDGTRETSYIHELEDDIQSIEPIQKPIIKQYDKSKTFLDEYDRQTDIVRK